MKNMFFLFIALLFVSPVFGVSENSLDDLYESEVLPFFLKNVKNHKMILSKKEEINLGYYVAGEHPGDTLLIVSPGRTESMIKYAELVYDLRNQGVDILLVDHLGQGYSTRYTKDPQKGYIRRYKKYTHAFSEGVNFFIRYFEYKKTIFLAHSMGSHIVIDYAKTYPQNVSKMILSAPMLSIQTGSYTNTQARILSGLLSTIGFGKSYAPGKGPYDPTSEEESFEVNDVTHSETRFDLKHRMYEIFPETVIAGPTNRWVFETLKASRRIQKGLENLNIPTIMFQAGDDQVVKKEDQKMACEKMPQCEMVVFEGAYHEILMEKDSLRDKALEIIQSQL